MFAWEDGEEEGRLFAFLYEDDDDVDDDGSSVDVVGSSIANPPVIVLSLRHNLDCRTVEVS